MKVAYNLNGASAVINSLTSGIIYTVGSLLQKQINIDTSLYLLSMGSFGICLAFLFTCVLTSSKTKRSRDAKKFIQTKIIHIFHKVIYLLILKISIIYF